MNIRWTRWILIWACWTFVALFLTSQVVLRGGSVYPIGNWEFLLRQLIISYLWLGLTPLVIWLTRRFPFEKTVWRNSLFVHVLTSIVITVAHILIYTVIIEASRLGVWETNFATRLINLITFNFHSNMVYYWGIVGITSMVDSYRLANLLENENSDVDYLERIIVKTSGRIFFVKTEEIDWLEVADNYVKVYVGRETHLIREKISNLEAKLNPDNFLRIHRSIIINTNRIKELQPLSNQVFTVVMQNGAELTSGRHFRENFSRLLVE